MSEATTSLARADVPQAPAGADVIPALRAFLRRPRLPAQVTGIGAGPLAALARLYLLDLAIMAVLLGLAAAAMAGGFKLPDNQINSLTLDGKTLALIVLFAPLLEEVAFRSWLSGRPGHLAAIVLSLAAIAILAAVGGFATARTDGSIESILIAASLVVGAIAALVMLRRRPAPAWFARAFPLFFYASTIAFALMHTLNYTEGTLPVLVLLVIPQAVIGAILGFARVTYGMWSNVLLHMAHNATFIGVVYAATQFAPK